MPQPLISLAPMDGVTDVVFRHLVAMVGKSDFFYTEFVSSRGLAHGALPLLRPLLYHEDQRPVLAQIFGNKPDVFRQTAIVLCQMGFDGIDINMGCPAKSVVSNRKGSALILHPELAQKIVLAVKQGVSDWENGATVKDCPDFSVWKKKKLMTRFLKQLEAVNSILPRVETQKNQFCDDLNKKKLVTVKTRIGYDQVVTQDWIQNLLEVKPDIISIHGRTTRQGYTGSANWTEISKAVELAKGSQTLIFGNGDAQDRNHAEQLCQKYGTDGCLIGRAAFGNPFAFSNETDIKVKRVIMAKKHVDLYSDLYQNLPMFKDRYYFLPMRKHLAWYIKSLPYASDYRNRLVRVNSSQEAQAILQEIIDSYGQGQ